tara:strand:- start:720 stop:1952 length:1233 start_codon:yes stop_codon:yes gene_type:complete
MASKAGPKIVKDNLILCLDAHDANSYAGEPTTNVLQYPESIGSGPTQESWSGTITANAVTAPDGTNTATKIEATSGHVYERLWIDTTYNSVQFTTGDTITYSIWIKTLDGTTTTSKGPHIWNYNSPTYGIVAQDLTGISPEWKLLKISHTVAAHQTNFAFAYSSSVSNGLTGLTYAIWRPQLEVKSYNTPYVKVSRSATNGWADLSRGGNHGTLTNMAGTGTSHYKEGQVISPVEAAYLDFDGSNDKVDCGSVTPDTGDFTVEFIYQLTGNGGRGGLFERKASSPYNGFSLGQGGSANWAFTVSGTSSFSNNLQSTWTYPTLNVWYHDVAVYSGGNTITLYRNGSSVATTTGTSQGNLSTQGTRTNFLIANRDNLTSLPCKVGLVRVYNKALSAAEVKQNFTAHRSRFGI